MLSFIKNITDSNVERPVEEVKEEPIKNEKSNKE